MHPPTTSPPSFSPETDQLDLEKIYRFYHGEAKIGFFRSGHGSTALRNVVIRAPGATQLHTAILSCGSNAHAGLLSARIFGDWEWDAFVMLCHFVAQNHKNPATEILNPETAAVRK